MCNDKVLMEEFIQGEKNAFEKLIIHHRHKAISFAKRFIHDVYMAEDIVQEAFAYVYVYRDRYDSKYSFKTYLYTIIRNKSIDYLRKKKEISLYDESLITSCNMVEEYLLRQDEIDCVNRNINKLKSDYRAVIHLIDYEGLSYKEAGKIMKRTTASIKILIYRARKKLRALIEKEESLNVRSPK